MITEDTIHKLVSMKLHTMAKTFRELLAVAPSHELTFEEKLGMIVDRVSSSGACSEIARFTPSSAPARWISGTTPDVDKVMRRLPSATPSSAMMIFMAVATLSKL